MSEKIGNNTNALNWFEIAALSIDRAAKFYASILDIQMPVIEMMGMKMSMFPADGMNGKVGGAVVQSNLHKPASTGTIVYLNANPDLQLVLNRITDAGGIIIMPKTMIDEQSGYMAFFTDSEGNNIGLHSTK